MKNLQYPIGLFSFDPSSAEDLTDQWIENIASLPKQLRKIISPFSEEQLDTPYRQDGWTVRQVVHHLADSHANGLIRIKLALTEDNPIIKPYDQDKWVKISDYRLPVKVSMKQLEGIHERWSVVLKSLTPRQFERTFKHPESGRWTIRKHTAQYAWHGNHHLAHIRTLKERNDW